ncbi:MAG: twin-arginine translocation signal domain-containing protein [Dehalococcoidia bacterium]|nr:MAG: twin-arginine translocation signal domain-containing protein [Dehalococcoidia bacterium]
MYHKSEKKTAARKSRQKQLQSITRRHFLKEASIIVGGIALTSVPLTSACSDSGHISTSNNTNNTPISTLTGENTSTKTTTKDTSITSVNTEIYTPNVTWNGEYIPPNEDPEVEPIPGCTTFVAVDRLYAIEHMWIKPIAEGIVVIGITEKFLEFLEDVFLISLQDVSTTITRNSYLGDIEAKKMNVEMVAPVSGVILQNNDKILDDPDWVEKRPYVSGWFQVIQLSNPNELNELLTAEKYISYQAKVVVE